MLYEVDNISHPALGHFKTILALGHQTPQLQQQYEYPHAINDCLITLAENEKQLPEPLVIELIDLLLQQANKDFIVKNGVLNRTAAYSSAKILTVLLSHIADPQVENKISNGTTPIGAALGKLNFDTIELLLNRDAEIKFGLLGPGNSFNTTYNFNITNVFSWLDEATRIAPTLPHIDQQNQATRIIERIKYLFATHFCNIENFRKLVTAACENPTSSHWSTLISGLKLGVTLAKPHLTYLITDAAPKLIDPSKLNKFHELFSVLSNEAITTLRDEAEKFLASLASDKTLSDLHVKQCIHSLFRITPDPAQQLDLEWKSKIGDVLILLFCSSPKFLLTVAINGGYGLMKLMLDILVRNASNKMNLTANDGKDELLAAIDHQHWQCALLLFETYQKNFDHEQLKVFSHKITLSAGRTKPPEEYFTLSKKLRDLVYDEGIKREKQERQHRNGFGSSGSSCGFGSGFHAPPPQSGRFGFGGSGRGAPRPQMDIPQPSYSKQIQEHLTTYKQNPFKSLGILPTEDKDMIAAIYTGLARRYHPDKGGPDKESNTKKIQEFSSAHTILMDDSLRQECYRKFGAPTSSAAGSYTAWAGM